MTFHTAGCPFRRHTTCENMTTLPFSAVWSTAHARVIAELCSSAMMLRMLLSVAVDTDLHPTTPQRLHPNITLHTCKRRAASQQQRQCCSMHSCAQTTSCLTITTTASPPNAAAVPPSPLTASDLCCALHALDMFWPAHAHIHSQGHHAYSKPLCTN